MTTAANGERSRSILPRRLSGRHPSGLPTIGLLAGMGVRSTGPFLDSVIEECGRQLGIRHEMDYPPMVVFSWPTPYYFDRELDHAKLEETIGAGLEWLADTGVDLIAMPCNSAHVYYDRLALRTDVPLIDMIEVAAASVPSDAGPVALLATQSTRDAGLYQRVLRARGLDVMDTEDVQARSNHVLDEIHRVSDLSGPRADFEALLSDLKKDGAKSALVACTDLNCLMDGESPIPLVDAGRALAAEVVSRWSSLAGLTPVADSDQEGTS